MQPPPGRGTATNIKDSIRCQPQTPGCSVTARPSPRVIDYHERGQAIRVTILANAVARTTLPWKRTADGKASRSIRQPTT
ncbi:MAG: hypothetical protein ACK53L_05535, partial [Pirellulaceae bacterium]